MAEQLNIGLVGPLPPPSGGMANQTQQLARLLEEEGARVDIVRTNSPYTPAWIGRLVIIRAFFRLFLYVIALWRAAGRVDIFHIMANSGWSWHLFAVPAVWVSRMRGVPAVINYRGGEAETFFAKSFRWVKPTLRASSAIVVPSSFLKEVFGKYGVEATIVSNIIDLSRFYPANNKPGADQYPRVLISRNLEPIYDIETGLRTINNVLAEYPGAQLIIAGSGPERERLEEVAANLGIADSVEFTGRVDSSNMPDLYRSADIMLNTSLVDNMPNSVLEALACGLPVVSTNVGGVPHIVEDNVTALLTPPRDDRAMSAAIIRLCSEKELATKLIGAGNKLVKQYAWPEVKNSWFTIYQQGLQGVRQ